MSTATDQEEVVVAVAVAAASVNSPVPGRRAVGDLTKP
jgi:hypothetical protein